MAGLSSMGYNNECPPSTPTTEGVSSNAKTDTDDIDDVDPSSQFDDGNDPKDDDDDIDLSAFLNHGAHQAGNASRPGRLLSPSEAKQVAEHPTAAAPEEHDVYSREELPVGCVRWDMVFSCKTSKLPTAPFDKDGVNVLLCTIIHTAFPDYQVDIIDIQRVGNVSTSDRNVATTTIQTVLESPRGLDFEEALRDYVRHQTWKQASIYMVI